MGRHACMPSSVLSRSLSVRFQLTGFDCRSFTFQVERDYDRERDEFESDREDSVALSEDMTSSPCTQHNGSYKTHSEEDASMGADGTK